MLGWIKIHRKIVDWEWYTDSTVVHLFFHLLIHANREEKCWRGITLLPGQVITGRESLALQTGISEQSIRTALNKLKSTSEITSKPYNKFSIITITNWLEYQGDDEVKEENQPANQPTTNQQLTSNQPHLKKDKKEEKEKNIGSPMAEKLSQFIAHRKALKKPMTPHAVELFIKKLDKMTDEGLDVAQLIDTAIERGWLTVYPPKGDTAEIKNQSGLPRGWKRAGI